jgi:hypothetical protein
MLETGGRGCKDRRRKGPEADQRHWCAIEAVIAEVLSANADQLDQYQAAARKRCSASSSARR